MKKVIIIILVFINFVFLYPNITYCNYRVKKYNPIEIQITNWKIEINNEQARIEIDKLFNIKHSYSEKNLKKCYGRSILMFRRVEMQKGLDTGTYIYTYAHELTHLKYLTRNETFTAYKIFVILYYSDNKIFKQETLKFARDVMKGNYKGTQYDCGYYIVKFLGKGEK